MRPRLRLLSLLALLPALLTGCLEIDTLVSVRADGSGTVRERVLFKGEAAAMVRDMAPADGDALLPDRARLEARAASMGPGVRLQRAERLSDNGSLGYEAVWSFADVSALRVVLDAEGAMPGAEPTPVADVPSLRFRLEQGTPPVLHVSSSLAEVEPPEDAAAAGAAGAAPVPPEMLEEMFGGMRFRLAVELEGGIARTNASHVEGARVVMLALDFDRLLDNPEAIAALAADDTPNPMRMQAALRHLPGLEVETETELRLAFASAEQPPEQPAEQSAEAAASAAADGQGADGAQQPAAGAAALSTDTPSATRADTAPVGRASSALPAGEIAGYAWTPVEPGMLGGLGGSLVALLDAEGALVKGMVIDVSEGRVRLRRASMDGGGTVELPLDAVRGASVFRRGP